MVSTRAGSWRRASTRPAAVGEVVDEAAMARTERGTRSLTSFMVVVTFSGLSRPLAFHMLQELGVPGIGGVAVFPPEQHEGGDLPLGEVPGDVGQAQHFVEIVAGLPAAVQGVGVAVVLQGGAEAGPLALHMAHEVGIPGAPPLAPLPPVE